MEPVKSFVLRRLTPRAGDVASLALRNAPDAGR